MNSNFKCLTNTNTTPRRVDTIPIKTKFNKLTLTKTTVSTNNKRQEENVQHRATAAATTETMNPILTAESPAAAATTKPNKEIGPASAINRAMLSSSSSSRNNDEPSSSQLFSQRLEFADTDATICSAINDDDDDDDYEDKRSSVHEDVDMEKLELSSSDIFPPFSNKQSSDSDGHVSPEAVEPMLNAIVASKDDSLKDFRKELYSSVLTISSSSSSSNSAEAAGKHIAAAQADTRSSLASQEVYDAITIEDSDDDDEDQSIPDNVSTINESRESLASNDGDNNGRPVAPPEQQSNNETVASDEWNKLNNFFDNVPPQSVEVEMRVSNAGDDHSTSSSPKSSTHSLTKQMESVYVAETEDDEQCDDGSIVSDRPVQYVYVSETSSSDTGDAKTIEKSDYVSETSMEDEPQSPSAPSNEQPRTPPPPPPPEPLPESVPESQLIPTQSSTSSSTIQIPPTNNAMPTIHFSAKFNIRIQLSGFDSSSSSSSGTCADDGDDATNDVVPPPPPNSASPATTASNKTTEKHSNQINDDDKENDALPHINISALQLNDSPKCSPKILKKTPPPKIPSLPQETPKVRVPKSTVKKTKKIADSRQTPTAPKTIVTKLLSQFVTPKPKVLRRQPKQTPTTNGIEAADEDETIDEQAQKLLDEVYGMAWRTPELMQKCVRRTAVTAKAKTPPPPPPPVASTSRNLTLDFSTFGKNIVDDLESTRIEATTTERRSSRNRKVNLSQITDDRDENDDEDDDSKLTDDDDDGINEWLPSNKSNKKGKNNSKGSSRNSSSGDKITYLDLTNYMAIEDEEHCGPNASADDLEKITQRFIAEPADGSPLPKPKTKRKLYTPQEYVVDPFPEDSPKVRPSEVTDKTNDVITWRFNQPPPMFRKPIPPAAVHTPKRLDELKKSEPTAAAAAVRSPTMLGTPKISDSVRKRATKKVIPSVVEQPNLDDIMNCPPNKYTFLRSLDGSIWINDCHPIAVQYRQTKFKPKRDELTSVLYDLFNKTIFDNQLDVPIKWNNKLTKTAGYCCNRRRAGVRSASIELSDKVLTSPDRLRCTLIHELCHAATWIFHGDKGHGTTWKAWSQKAMRVFAELPIIARCHAYEIEHKYTYACTLCGAKSYAHSKSKKVENIRCALCHGSIEIYLNKKDTFGNACLAPVRKASAFALFVKQRYNAVRAPGILHADVMRMLSTEYAQLTAEEKSNLCK